MAQQTLSWTNLKVGLFVTAALVILATAIIAVGEKTGFFSASNTLTTRFEKVDGLKVAAPVWLAGVEVGSVSAVEFVQDGDRPVIDVRFTVNRQYAELIRQDSIATIAGRGLLGDKLIQITPGSLGYDVVPDGGRLQSQPATDWDGMLEQAKATFEDLGVIVRSLRNVSEDIEEGRGSFGKFVKDTSLYDNLDHLAAALTALTLEATEGEGALARILRDPEVYDETMAILRDVRSGEGSLGMLLSNPGLYDDARGVVGRADGMLARMETLLGSVESGEGSAGKMLQDEDLHDSLNDTLGELQALIKDIQENPRKYINLRIFGR